MALQCDSFVDGRYSFPLMFEKLPEVNQEGSQWTDCESRDAINLIYENLHKLDCYFADLVSVTHSYIYFLILVQSIVVGVSKVGAFFKRVLNGYKMSMERNGFSEKYNLLNISSPLWRDCLLGNMC